MKEYVLITGASSGIGKDATEFLLSQGFSVAPCVRKESDLAKWKATKAQPIFLDVTDPESIQRGVKEFSRIAAGADKVHLINNAGIAVGGPVEAIPAEKWRAQFDVNVFGLISVTQALLPLVRATQGRIINISSISGLFASPYMGAYASSKFAVEAISDALRRELLRSGVEVILIEPGPIATPIWEKSLGRRKDEYAQYSGAMRTLYGEDLERFAGMVELTAKDALPVAFVSRTILRALRSAKPKARYLVVKKSVPWQLRLMKLLPSRMADRMIMKGFGRK
ncbi:MAG: SDR family oxidoreductase [Bacteriovoracia bacterium]